MHLRLRPEPSATDPSKTTYVISEHEDFYHPDALMAMFVPPLAPFVRWALGVGAAACRVGAGVLRGMAEARAPKATVAKTESLLKNILY